MLDRLKTTDVRNLIALLIAIEFFILSVMGRISQENIMNITILVCSYLFAKHENKK